MKHRVLDNFIKTYRALTFLMFKSQSNVQQYFLNYASQTIKMYCNNKNVTSDFFDSAVAEQTTGKTHNFSWNNL